MNKYATRNSEFVMIDQKALKRQQLRRSGFTLLELLIVTAMIILLLGILIVALNKASKTAQATNTRALMTSISQALARFQGDIGYLPPVLDVDRRLDVEAIPDPLNNYVAKVQDWYSITSLADYLLGYGNDQQDGNGNVNDGTIGALGIRDPGPDGVWGATIGLAGGTLGERNQVGDASEGKVYGPYLELKDDHLLGSIDTNGNVSLPGEGNYDPNDPKVILDYWGQPIRYYRQVYRQGGLKYPYRPDPNVNGDILPSLADVFVLRPFNLDPGSATDSFFADANNDTTTSFELKAAKYALFSSGADRFFDSQVRFDAGDTDGDGITGENEDNVVEVGQ